MALIPVVVLLWLLVYLLARWQDNRRGSQWRLDVAAAGVLALACVGFTWRLWFDGAYMPADGGDLVSFLLPTYRFAAQSLHAGQFPLWNPHLYGGASHVADSQAGFLYPPNLALFLVRPDFGVRALEGLSTLHLWWAGLGMYVFVRSLRWNTRSDATGWGENGAEHAGRLAALGAGIAFAFSDSLWIHFGNLNYVAVASWLPWVMVCFMNGLEGARKERKRGKEGDAGEHSDLTTDHRLLITDYRFLAWAALGGLLLGIGTLAGHVQASLFIGMAAVLYGLFWLYFEAQVTTAGRALLRLLLSLVVLAGVAILVAAPLLIPSLQLAPYLDRAAWRYQETVGYSLAPPQLVGLVAPGFFGRGPQLHWGLWPRVEAGYIGILPLALATLAILARRNRTTWTLLGMSGVAFLLSLGIYSVPHGWLTLIPGFDLLRAPARLTLVMDFGLAALAGIGLHVLVSQIGAGDGGTWKALTRLSDGLGWISKAVLLVAVPLTFIALVVMQNQDPTLYLRVSVAAIAVLLFVGFLLASWALIGARRAGWARPVTIGVLAVLLIYLDLASTGAYNDLSYDDPTLGFQHEGITSFLAQQEQPVRIDARTDIDSLWQPDTALLYGIDDVWGVANPSLLAAYNRYWEGMGSRSTPLYDFLSATYLIGKKDVELDWSKFELVFDGDPDLNVYRNEFALPRAQIIHDALLVHSHDEAWDAIQQPDFDPAQQVVVEANDGQLPTAAPATGPENIQWLEQSANRLTLEVETTAPGYLVLSNAWYPGWVAETEINGHTESRPILRANTAFWSIPLQEAGSYQIRLNYQPPAWRYGWLLVALLLALAIVAAIAVLLRRRREQP